VSFLDRIINVEQGSPEWRQSRCGRITASRIDDIMAKGKSGEAASRANYRMEIVCEILSGEPQEDSVFSKDMQWGHDQEPYARSAYQVAENCIVDQVGMVLHPRFDRCAASPDGLVNWDGENEPEGLVEIKAPKTKNHLAYLQSGKVPSEYRDQMCWQMRCTGAKWVDFVSFDPRLKGDAEHLQLYICRMERDEARILKIEREVERFWSEVEATVNHLRNYGKAA
jgi:putative phage-type endonuclease